MKCKQPHPGFELKSACPFLKLDCNSETLNLPRLHTTNINKYNEKNGLSKKRSRQYSSEIVTDTDYTDDLALLASAYSQDESLMHNLEQVLVSM